MSVVSPREQQRPRTRVEGESDIEAVYHMGEVLGKGSFGVVKEITHKLTKKKFAMKIVSKDKPGSMAILLMEREVEMLNRMHHPHIIKLEEVYETPKKVFLILELCRGGELSDILKKKRTFKEEEVKGIMKMLAEAVVYMHDKDMVHRDLKLENILVSTENPDKQFDIKVTDFGLSYMRSLPGCDDSNMHQKCGTLYYMAPEVVRTKHEYTKLCDVWSMGVIMYTLLCGNLPFNGATRSEVEDAILKGTLSFSNEVEWYNVSSQAKDLICSMLSVSTMERLTARQILEDPWITGGAAKERLDPLSLLDESPDLNQSRTNTTTNSSQDSCPPPKPKPDINKPGSSASLPRIKSSSSAISSSSPHRQRSSTNAWRKSIGSTPHNYSAQSRKSTSSTNVQSHSYPSSKNSPTVRGHRLSKH